MNTQQTLEVKLTLTNPSENASVKEWRFTNLPVIRIGRSPDNDVVINEPLVSRRHLELHQVNQNQWRLINQGVNGTYLNGILVSQALITPNSVLQLAQSGPLLKFDLQILTVQKPPSRTPEAVCQHEGNAPGSLFCIHCGEPIVEVERLIRQYKVLRTLGQGGMGTTYLAWDKRVSQEHSPQMLVIKEMNADMAQIEKARELFEREARILKNLSHPGIPKYYDFFVEAGKKYLAMELIHGQDLEKRIFQQGPVIPQQAIDWAIQTCEVLEYIHEQNPPLIHRDIKPANLMARSTNNHIVVLDFGAVKEIGTFAGTRIGAEGYCAPEQYRGQPCTQSDLYAIGPTIIFLLTGENPMGFYRPWGTGYKFDTTNIPTITPQLRQVIEKATAMKVGDRFQTAQELSQALGTCK
ncbi:protein kinase domain-containing protein [Merismopedia glauca]|uniref:Serine/threonine protein kinase n=1 Tax=Merismopedia glauca CCAP 1448/3 TaxID=1296344 RepID=A0A2T1C361_9CYAN|nr:protein kinase [Merismopedia glauca]PSB02644.1 serine/threonine protein kinase [Merismopedia glauca CCAP 1448/3]